jgi:hypothetical protein
MPVNRLTNVQIETVSEPRAVASACTEAGTGFGIDTRGDR